MDCTHSMESGYSPVLSGYYGRFDNDDLKPQVEKFAKITGETVNANQ